MTSLFHCAHMGCTKKDFIANKKPLIRFSRPPWTSQSSFQRVLLTREYIPHYLAPEQRWQQGNNISITNKSNKASIIMYPWNFVILLMSLNAITFIVSINISYATNIHNTKILKSIYYHN